LCPERSRRVQSRRVKPFLEIALLHSIQAFDLDIEKIFTAHPDATLFSSLPGAGPHLAPCLLAAFGDDRDRRSTVGTYAENRLAMLA
jgi:hypothetical protein